MTKLTTLLSCIAAVLVLFAATACVGGDTNNPGCGGQKCEQPTTGHDCHKGETSEWDMNSLTVNFSKPNCPFTIDMLQSNLEFAAQADAPSSSISFNVYGQANSSLTVQAINALSGYGVVAGAGPQYFLQSAGDPNTYYVQVDLSGTPGTYPDANGHSMYDSVNATANAMAYGGDSRAWHMFPGEPRDTVFHGQILGPTSIATGLNTSWRSYPEWDTTGYYYKWVVDGQTVSGATAARYSQSLTDGTHTVSAVAIRTDNTRDSTTITVKAFTLNISGPTSIKPNVTCAWSGSASGGVAPYTFQWSAPGGSGSGQNWDYNDTGTGSPFTIQLIATDAAGTQITVNRTVTITSAAHTCTF